MVSLVFFSNACFQPSSNSACWICGAKTQLYFYKINKRNTRKGCEICSKLTTEKIERLRWRLSDVFIVNFEIISRLYSVLLLLNLNKEMLAWYFFKGCVRYIFVTLFCISKLEHLWNKEKCFLFHFERSFRFWDDQILIKKYHEKCGLKTSTRTFLILKEFSVKIILKRIIFNSFSNTCLIEVACYKNFIFQ